MLLLSRTVMAYSFWTDLQKNLHYFELHQLPLPSHQGGDTAHRLSGWSLAHIVALLGLQQEELRGKPAKTLSCQEFHLVTK